LAITTLARSNNKNYKSNLKIIIAVKKINNERE